MPKEARRGHGIPGTGVVILDHHMCTEKRSLSHLVETVSALNH